MPLYIQKYMGINFGLPVAYSFHSNMLHSFIGPMENGTITAFTNKARSAEGQASYFLHDDLSRLLCH